MHGLSRGLISASTIALVMAAPAAAQTARRPTLQAQLDQAMAMIREQRDRIDAQAAELAELRTRLDATTRVAAANPFPSRPGAPVVPGSTAAAPGDPATVASVPVPLERVGQAPEDADRPIELAVLDQQGSVVTRSGQLSGEWQLDYARSDRNRAIFRGIELVEAVLVGVFDINENRQDILTASASLRYGLTDRLEVGVRLPYVYRSDTSIIAPVSGSTNNDAAATIDNSVKGDGIGDLEVNARYQLIDGGRGSPYVIANLQGVFPTGTDPFAVPRNSSGRA